MSTELCGCAPCQGCSLQDMIALEAKNKMLMVVNDGLAALVGELRSEIISLREDLVAKRELVSHCRSLVTWEAISEGQDVDIIRDVRRALGVNY